MNAIQAGVDRFATCRLLRSQAETAERKSCCAAFWLVLRAHACNYTEQDCWIQIAAPTATQGWRKIKSTFGGGALPGLM